MCCPGEDLDPTNAGYQPSGGPGGRGRDKIVAGDELDPMEAQRRGLAPQSQRFASGGDYALVEEDRAPPPPPPDAPLPPMGRGRGATMPAWMSQLQADVGGASKKKKKKKDKDKKKSKKKDKKAAKKAKKAAKKEAKKDKKRKRESDGSEKKSKKKKKGS